MASIVYLAETVYCNILRCIYLTNEKDFLNFDSILNIFKKKMTLISDVFLNLLIPK